MAAAIQNYLTVLDPAAQFLAYVIAAKHLAFVNSAYRRVSLNVDPDTPVLQATLPDNPPAKSSSSFRLQVIKMLYLAAGDPGLAENVGVQRSTMAPSPSANSGPSATSTWSVTATHALVSSTPTLSTEDFYALERQEHMTYVDFIGEMAMATHCLLQIPDSQSLYAIELYQDITYMDHFGDLALCPCQQTVIKSRKYSWYTVELTPNVSYISHPGDMELIRPNTIGKRTGFSYPSLLRTFGKWLNDSILRAGNGLSSNSGYLLDICRMILQVITAHMVPMVGVLSICASALAITHLLLQVQKFKRQLHNSQRELYRYQREAQTYWDSPTESPTDTIRRIEELAELIHTLSDNLDTELTKTKNIDARLEQVEQARGEVRTRIAASCRSIRPWNLKASDEFEIVRKVSDSFEGEVLAALACLLHAIHHLNGRVLAQAGSARTGFGSPQGPGQQTFMSPQQPQYPAQGYPAQQRW
ncbi:hypothetical protein BU23DRAFT_561049 [Bimuria novae-zelandiae CBS 107.79]|uniref:Uncharacterized protein n=1 Tax=Bimuria novae-zelandiae CBS 107.79 TaxID=1447943 RepID=A0A6A5UWU2_9PLEO|nr:hypothetical protein BU23DRAFT_561049 [Bimuria novae-zelandiae CBS 107.79]